VIVGTAGHIDHGKTALVRALTGTDTDRLAEEKARGITIELGFAYMARPDGGITGFVDVPGHQRLMKTMLAGAGGIDFLLLVVAADDGIMPQTREHLAVAELLGISRGIVALTKCDLVDEPRRAEVAGAISALLAAGSLAGSAVLPVSAQTGEGLAALRDALDRAAAIPQAARPGPLRFAIDRSFSLPGAGTVVTGVMAQGQLGIGDTLMLSPCGRDVRVRSLHVQNRSGERAVAGQRCGVNLGGRIAARAIRRGDWLLASELHAPTTRIDAELRLLPDAPRPLRHWKPVRLHHAAAEVGAHVALLLPEPLKPGATALVQLVLDSPIAAAVGSGTLGGGRLIDLRPPQRRRSQPRRLEQLASMALADPAASLRAQLARWPWFVERGIFKRDRALDDAVMQAIEDEVPHERAGPYRLGPEAWQRLQASILAAAQDFHRRFPQLLGPNRQRLTAALELPRPVAEAALVALIDRQLLVREGGLFRMPEHRLGLDTADTELWRRIAPLLADDARFAPPRVADIAKLLGAREFEVRRVLKAMALQQRVTEVVPDHFFRAETMTELGTIIAELASAEEDGLFGVAQLRDRLGGGRKVAIQLLEWFDRHGLTLRRGDQRLIDPPRLEAFISRAA
jgi:selenocysteine-specific elongation factor